VRHPPLHTVMFCNILSAMTHPLAFPTAQSISGAVSPRTRQPSGDYSHVPAWRVLSAGSLSRSTLQHHASLSPALLPNASLRAAAPLQPAAPCFWSSVCCLAPQVCCRCALLQKIYHKRLFPRARGGSQPASNYRPAGDKRYAAAADRAAKALWKRRSQVNHGHVPRASCSAPPAASLFPRSSACWAVTLT
jgi:hypothetical protein